MPQAMWGVLIFTSILAPTVAVAQVRTLTHPGGAKNVIVWKDEKAHSEGIQLISAGVNKTNPHLLLPLLACVVPVGSQAVVTDGGFFSSTITVTSGREAGCRGVISNDYFERKK